MCTRKYLADKVEAWLTNGRNYVPRSFRGIAYSRKKFVDCAARCNRFVGFVLRLTRDSADTRAQYACVTRAGNEYQTAIEADKVNVR